MERRKFLRWLGLAAPAAGVALVPGVTHALVAMPEEPVALAVPVSPMSLEWMTEEVAGLVEARFGRSIGVIDAAIGTAGVRGIAGATLDVPACGRLSAVDFRRRHLLPASDHMTEQVFQYGWTRVSTSRTGPGNLSFWTLHDVGGTEARATLVRRPSGIVVRGVEIFTGTGQQIVSFDMAGG